MSRILCDDIKLTIKKMANQPKLYKMIRKTQIQKIKNDIVERNYDLEKVEVGKRNLL